RAGAPPSPRGQSRSAMAGIFLNSPAYWLYLRSNLQSLPLYASARTVMRDQSHSIAHDECNVDDSIFSARKTRIAAETPIPSNHSLVKKPPDPHEVNALSGAPT
ncbi:hypothetical protein, partial [Burkholderia stabilis]|uniref:hypothetical protein n=1 Tax=Burkholderia stabilis TaxID=95485 RepID=UPI001F4B8EC1